MLTIEAGQALTIWTARAAAVLYVATLLLLLRKRWIPARAVSTVGFAIYLSHVALAFHFFYRWSHCVAYAETARQSRQLFGADWGGGLYLNYLFTLLWFADCAVSWLAPQPHGPRLARARIAVHAFLLFMVLNATVVVWVLRE